LSDDDGDDDEVQEEMDTGVEANVWVWWQQLLQQEKIHHGSMKQLLFLGEEVPKDEEEEQSRARAGAGAGAGEVSKGGAEQELASRVSAHMEFS
jgi:hypothetical protein